jgi:hypothetical protein
MLQHNWLRLTIRDTYYQIRKRKKCGGEWLSPVTEDNVDKLSEVKMNGHKESWLGWLHLDA